MRAVVLAALTEGVPGMLDTIPVQSAFARRRWEAWSNLRRECAPTVVTRAGPRSLSIAHAFEPEDGKQMVTLVAVRRV